MVNFALKVSCEFSNSIFKIEKRKEKREKSSLFTLKKFLDLHQNNLGAVFVLLFSIKT